MFETDSGLQAVAKKRLWLWSSVVRFKLVDEVLNRLCGYWIYPTPYVVLLDHRISNPGGPVQDESLRM